MAPDTRERILQTAARLFLEQGYAATGISTICREAQVNSGSLYHFFTSKESLLAGVLKWYEDHLDPIVMGPIEAAEQDPIERIFKLLAWYRAGMVATECRLGCPIGNLALEVSDTHPDVRPLIDVNFNNWAARIESWLHQAAHRLPPDLDRRALSRFILTVMEGGLMQARASDELAPFDDSVSQLRAYLNALLQRAADTTAQPPRSLP